MKVAHVIHVIPFERLRPAASWGRRSLPALAGAALALILVHLLARWSDIALTEALSQPLPEILANVLTSGLGPALLGAGIGYVWSGRRHPFKSEAVPIRPGPGSTLRAWTHCGDVVELMFDSGAWLLVRNDVNDREWRNVLRLLLWSKRVPNRLNA